MVAQTRGCPIQVLLYDIMHKKIYIFTVMTICRVVNYIDTSKGITHGIHEFMTKSEVVIESHECHSLESHHDYLK